MEHNSLNEQKVKFWRHLIEKSNGSAAKLIQRDKERHRRIRLTFNLKEQEPGESGLEPRLTESKSNFFVPNTAADKSTVVEETKPTQTRQMSNKLEEPTYIDEIKIANIGPRHMESYANVSCEGPSREVTQLEIDAFKYQVTDGMPGSIKEAAKTTKKQGFQKINLMNETSKLQQNDRMSNVQTDNLHPFSKPQSQAGELPTINHATPPETSALSKEHVLKAQVVRTGKAVLDNPTATDPRSDSVSYPFQNSAMQHQRFRNEDTENHSSTYTLLQPIHVQQPAGVYG